MATKPLNRNKPALLQDAKAKPAAVTKAKPAAKALDPKKPALLQGKAGKTVSALDKLKAYAKTGAGQLKDGLKSAVKNPGQAVKNAVKSIPQGRVLKVAAAGALAAGGVAAGVAASKRSEARKAPAAKQSGANEDVPQGDKPHVSTQPRKSAAPQKPAAKSGGNYPVYKKNSSNAASFRSAFAAARTAGKGEFTWEGRKYNTKLKSK